MSEKLKEELKASKRYEYGTGEITFCSHKYHSVILFAKNELQYIIYDNADPEGTVIFELSYHIDISLFRLERIIEAIEGF